MMPDQSRRVVRRHLLILLLITVLVRGWMFASYPLGGIDDNQAAQHYLIDQLLQGNLLIGNLRYQTGYPLVIAPTVAVARPFGQFDDRIVLLVQVALSAAVPFLIYDILRRRRSPREALIVALVVLLDPFGLQFAHFWLPEWWIAFCLMFGWWLIEQGWRRHYPILGTALAGLVLGIAALARLNFAPVIALLGVLLLALSGLARRTRLLMFAVLGVASLSIIALYTVMIQYPSTGMWSLSCISGVSLTESVEGKGLTIAVVNGPNSARYLDLLKHRSPREILFLGDTYGDWRNPAAWASPEEQATFERQDFAGGYPVSAYTLAYYLGPCAVDALLRGVYVETVRAQPLAMAAGILRETVDVLTQTPINQSLVADTLGLPTYDSLTFAPGGSLGFRRAIDGYYTGQWVWTPGIWLYSTLFPLIHLLKWLTLPALVWAWRSREWFYRAAALLLLAWALMLSTVDQPEPRIYSALYPLTPILIGGMIAAALSWWAALWSVRTDPAA